MQFRFDFTQGFHLNRHGPRSCLPRPLFASPPSVLPRFHAGFRPPFRWLSALVLLGVLGYFAESWFAPRNPSASDTRASQSVTAAPQRHVGSSHAPLGGIHVPSSPRSSSLQDRLGALEAVADQAQREKQIEYLIAELRAADPRMALDTLCIIVPSPLVDEVIARLLRGWTETVPEAVAAWAATLPAGARRMDLLGHVAVVWANRELPDAAAWAGHLSDPAERALALQAVAGEAVRTDALEALRLMGAEPASAARDAVLRRAAMELATQDPDALSAWAAKTPPGPARDELLAGIALVWSQCDPHQAAIVASGDLPEGRLRDDTLVGIAQRWGQTNPAQAASWVATWPADEARLAAIENVALSWSQKDTAAAASWLDGLAREAGGAPPATK